MTADSIEEKPLLQLKAALIKTLSHRVDEKVVAAENALSGLEESLNSATKSSAGDKHETGRAMVQIEMDNGRNQLAKARTLKAELAQVPFHKTFASVEAGSFVATSEGFYLMAIGLGEVTVGGESCYVISMASPLGQALRGKKVEEMAQFRDRTMRIEAIV